MVQPTYEVYMMLPVRKSQNRGGKEEVVLSSSSSEEEAHGRDKRGPEAGVKEEG